MDTDYIERWLNRMQKEREWTDNAWNRYCEQVNTLINRAIRWKRLGVSNSHLLLNLGLRQRCGAPDV